MESAIKPETIVDKGQVHLPVLGGIYVEAYHTPDFAENILSVGKLSKRFDLFLGSDHNGRSYCSIRKKESAEVVLHVQEDHGLFRIDMSKSIKTRSGHKSTTTHKDDSDCLNCIIWAAASSDNIYKPLPHDNKALHSHYMTGHPSPDRLLRLAQTFQDVPQFRRDTLRNLFCVPCSITMMRRAPVRKSLYELRRPLELVHIDITGPVTPSIGNKTYAVSILDDFSTNSDAYFIKRRSELAKINVEYRTSAELHTGYKLRSIRIDGAGENKSDKILAYCRFPGIELNYGPPRAPQSNGAAERLNQEFRARTRVLLLSEKPLDELRAEAMNHACWLRNRLLSDHINGNIPILVWKPTTRVRLSTVPTFGQPGFAFLYRSKTTPHKKILARSVHGHFVGIHSDMTLPRVYVPESKKVILTRTQDFIQYGEEKLAGVASLLDDLSRQSDIETNIGQDGIAEALLTKAFQAHLTSLNPPLYYGNRSRGRNFTRRMRMDPNVPRSFQEAIGNNGWFRSIDREYRALVKRGPWKYVEQIRNMEPVPFTWVFKLKPLEATRTNFLHKVRFCVRGKQTPHVDFDPATTYAPVASH